MAGFDAFLASEGIDPETGAATEPVPIPEPVAAEPETPEPAAPEAEPEPVAAEVPEETPTKEVPEEEAPAAEVPEADPEPQGDETEAEAAARVLRYRYLGEDTDLDIDEVLADGERTKWLRDTIQKGLNQDRLNERELQQAREEAVRDVNQRTERYLIEQGFTFETGADGKLKVVPPAAAPTMAPPSVPTPDLDALRAKAVGPEATALDVVTYTDAMNAGRTKASPQDVGKIVDERLSAYQQKQSHEQVMTRLQTEFAAALTARDADFAATGEADKADWRQDAQNAGLAEMSRKGSTHETVIAAVHRVADRAKRLGAKAAPPPAPAAKPKRKKAPTVVPAGGTPEAVDPFTLKIENDDGTVNAENEAAIWAKIEAMKA